MIAVIWLAEARLKASINQKFHNVIINGRATGRLHDVENILPRTLSFIITCTSPLLKRLITASPTVVPKWAAISRAKSGLALPEKF